MKLLKLILILCFNLLLTANIFGQAAVDISLIATDGTININLAVGLDLTATTCLDIHLGEYELPPPPPPGSGFEIRFDLQPYGCPLFTSLKDYRPPGDPPIFPFTGMVEHTLWWITSSPALPIDITYNIPPGAEMYLKDQIGGSLLNLGPFIGQGIATIPGSYTIIFSGVLLIMNYDNIVPVELVSFTASVLQNEKAVQLNWTTVTEMNNSGFEILRFTQNNNAWEKIGFVPGFGTTTEPKTYSFTDENVTTGTYKYRLKQIDFDGSFEYLPIGQAGSNEIEVEVDFTPKEFVLYQNYPNPFNPSTTIKFEIPDVETTRRVVFTTLKVYDILGNDVASLVNEEKQPGVYEVEFNPVSSIKYPASGVYFYQLKAGQFSETKKMVLLR